MPWLTTVTGQASPGPARSTFLFPVSQQAWELDRRIYSTQEELTGRTGPSAGMGDMFRSSVFLSSSCLLYPSVRQRLVPRPRREEIDDFPRRWFSCAS